MGGAAAPITRPAAMAVSPSAPICNRKARCTVARVAPTHLSAAIVCSLPCRWLETALATPIPPTRRAASPASVRNRPTRSSWRLSEGFESRTSRSLQPPSGNAASSPAGPICDRRALRYQCAVAMPHQGAGLHQAGGLQRCVIHHQPGPERYAGGEPVRLARKHGAHRERRRADPELVADPEPEAVQQSLLGHGAAAGQGVGERHAAFEPHAIDQRIGAVHRFELDQRAARAVLEMGHAPHGDDMREGGGVRLQVVRHRVGERPRELHQLHIAAQDHPGVAREAGLQRLAERADGGGGGDAQHQAGEEDAKSPHAPSKLAPGDAPRSAQFIGGRLQGISPRRARRSARPRYAPCGRTARRARDRG